MSKFSSRNLVVTIKNKAINKVITNLHISASILKTLSGAPNTSEITIWNLNQDSREDLYNNVYDFTDNIGITNVEITEDEKLLFQGELINVNSIQKQVDGEWVTNLYCGDGYNAYRKNINKKYEKGMTRKEIVNDLINELDLAGVAVKGLVDDIAGCTDKSLLKAIVIDGEIMKNIKNLISTCLGGGDDNADAYIDEGKVNIIAKNKVINNKIIINKGLLELPTLTEQGINCKLLLDASLKIGAEFEVETKSSNVAFGNLTKYKVQKERFSGTGSYKVLEIKHNVDNFSDEVASTEIIGLNLIRVTNGN